LIFIKAVNRELAKIWKENESVRSLKVTVTNSKKEIKVLMESEMDVPKVQFQLGINHLSVVYFLQFKKGSFKWFNEAESETVFVTSFVIKYRLPTEYRFQNHQNGELDAGI
jgi:hypothetical protein